MYQYICLDSIENRLDYQVAHNLNFAIISLPFSFAKYSLITPYTLSYVIEERNHQLVRSYEEDSNLVSRMCQPTVVFISYYFKNTLNVYKCIYPISIQF